MVHDYCVAMVTLILDDEIDNSEDSSDLFCVACNKLFKTAKVRVPAL